MKAKINVYMYRQLLACNSLEGESKYGGWTDQDRGTKSRTNQNWKQVHVAVDPPFTDSTQYLPRPLVAIPISLVLRLSRRAVLRLMRLACYLKMMRVPHIRMQSQNG